MITFKDYEEVTKNAQLELNSIYFEFFNKAAPELSPGTVRIIIETAISMNMVKETGKDAG